MTNMRGSGIEDPDIYVIYVTDWYMNCKRLPESIIEGVIKHETPKAILFSTDLGEIWIPKSQIKRKKIANPTGQTKLFK